MQRLNRRDFLRLAATLGGVVAASSVLEGCRNLVSETAPPSTPTAEALAMNPTPRPDPTAVPSATPRPTATRAPTATATTAPTPTVAAAAEALAGRVALVKTTDRAEGVRRAVALLGLNPARGRSVVLKPNFNSADPPPGSTHLDTLRALLEQLWAMGAREITIADRSGMGDTPKVMERLGVYRLAQELNARTLTFDSLAADEWVMLDAPGSHWKRGFPFARPCLECDALVQTCNLKTHRFGGHFTLSLKNAVGMVARLRPGDGYNYMTELHGSPHQRRMIAEINTAYTPALVVMDGVEAFVNGGPDQGQKVAPGVVLAGMDRVALDAVGVALLRLFGTTPEVSQGPIFGLQQLARAVELGLGVDAPEEIHFVTDDAASAAFADRIRDILLA